MNLKKILIVAIMLFALNCFAQTKIEAKDGIHYITTDIDYPITGTYLFKGTEPTVELNGNGAGFYQQHEQLKKAILWGIECNESGEPKFTKGYDNVAYTFWFQYTNPEADEDKNWQAVEFSIHFNALKIFINGERSKDYPESANK